MTNNTLPILRPIHVEFRAARSLCRRLSASDLFKQIKPKDVPALASTSSSSFNQSTVVLPPSPKQFFKKSSAQVETSVGQNVLQKSCELRSGQTKTERPKYPPPLRVRYPTYEEREKVIKAAKEAGFKSVSSYLRFLSLGSHYKPPRDTELTQALLMLNRELTRQGHNLNQIAKHSNSSSTPAETDGMLGIVARSMLQTHKAVRKALACGEPEP